MYQFYSKQSQFGDCYYNERSIKLEIDYSIDALSQLLHVTVLKNKYDFDRVAYCSAQKRYINYFRQEAHKLLPGRMSNKQLGMYRPPELELDMLCLLDMRHHNIKFFHRYRFMWCKYSIPLEYDFFCLLIVNPSKIVPFVIEMDEPYHFTDNPDVHRRDIIKQYYLRCMNIHLPRIKHGTDICDQLAKFTVAISDTNIYVAKNPIKPIEKYFQSDEVIYGLRYFHKYCLQFPKRDLPDEDSTEASPDEDSLWGLSDGDSSEASPDEDLIWGIILWRSVMGIIL